MKTRNSSVTFTLVWAICMLFTSCKCAKLAQKQPNIPNGGRAVAVAVSPFDDNLMVVASETGGLFRTSNKGLNWSHVSGTSTFRYRDVLFVPADPIIVIAAANVDSRNISGGGIYRSTNGGRNWSKAVMNAPNTACTNKMAAHCLSFDTFNGRLWAGTDCGLFYSDDQGVNWTFLSSAIGLGINSIRAVLTPAANRMVVLTGNSVRVSTNGGSNWTVKNNGLPTNRAAGEHNQIAISRINNQHIYFAFNSWIGGVPKNELYYTQDFGDNWSVIVDQGGWNRPPFVVLAEASLSGANTKLDLYFSDGGCQLRRREVVHGSIHGFNPWNNLNSDHCDAADIGIGKDGKTPILLASDGGVHITEDNGANWTMTGTGSKGYNALQITEVTGQKTDDDGKADLYFGTQDNDNWASTDYGASWPNKRCCEGFYLNVPRTSLPVAQTIHTGVSCAGCGNYKSGPALTAQASWNNPPRNAGNPALIKPAYYAQEQFNIDSTAWSLARSTNTGGSWSTPVTLSEDVMNLPLIVGTASNPIIYLAVRKPGTTNGAPNIGLKRISGFLGSSVVQSNLTGFGNIGTFPTMFAWYEVFGVKLEDPNYILVPDIVNNVVQKSTDGGLSWVPDNNLTDLVTNSGEFKFSWDGFSQISSFGFDPECWGHIMVGTQQAGIFQTFNNGISWEKVAGSEKIPYVGSFFFSKKGEVVISSYGRGLWRFRYDCPDQIVDRIPPRELFYEDPVLWSDGHWTPINNLVVTADCTSCGFYILEDGQITDVITEPSSGQVKEIFVDQGNFKGFDHKGESIPLSVAVSTGNGGNGILSDDEALQKILEGDKMVKGIYLEGDLYKGVILHDSNLDQGQLPLIAPEVPRVRFNQNSDLGIPINELKNLKIVGYGLDQKFPVEILLDGKDLGQDIKSAFDDKGVFALEVPPIFGIGNHQITIRQKTDKGVFEELLNLRITVADYPDDNK